METNVKKEFNFRGFVLNGFVALVILLAMLGGMIYAFSSGVNATNDTTENISFISFFVLLFAFILTCFGFYMLEPNEVSVMVFFGKYVGTVNRNGFFWSNPFISKKKLTLRARNLDIEPIKVNDKTGNPILIGLVMVWRLKDTYRPMFEIDSNFASSMNVTNGSISVSLNNASTRMNAFENFVRIQSDAALREVAGLYAYDNNNDHKGDDELTLRSGGHEINEQLELKLNERLEFAGIEVIEARINYLTYAPEIAAVMLRRQQASAVIAAREKIVEGAVSMVKLALDKLNDEDIELDEEKKAAMVSNLLVVLCSDESAQPVVNTGTLNH